MCHTSCEFAEDNVLVAEQDDFITVDEEWGVHVLAECENFARVKLSLMNKLFAVEVKLEYLVSTTP